VRSEELSDFAAQGVTLRVTSVEESRPYRNFPPFLRRTGDPEPDPIYLAAMASFSADEISQFHHFEKLRNRDEYELTGKLIQSQTLRKSCGMVISHAIAGISIDRRQVLCFLAQDTR
jgi:hypothetical protein